MTATARERLGDVYELGVVSGVVRVLRDSGHLARVGPWSPLEGSARDALDALSPARERPSAWDTSCAAIATCAHLHGQTLATRWREAFPGLREAHVYAPAERVRGGCAGRIEIAEALGLDAGTLPEALYESGHVAHADLAVLATRRGTPHLLVVECSLHLATSDDLPDLRRHVPWRRMIERAALRHLRQGGFANLRASVDARVGVTFPPPLRALYRTVVASHREFAKLYQGCAYARALAESVARARARAVEVTVVASTMLGFEHLSATCPAPGQEPSATWRVLASCADLYPGFRETTAELRDELDRLWEVGDLLRSSVPGEVASLAPAEVQARALDLRVEEVLVDHPRMAAVRPAHGEAVASLIASAPRGQLTVGCLAGAPGIGKTTAVRRALRALEGGWLLLYASPRIAINGDQRARITDEDPRALCLTANARLADVVTARQRDARGFAYASGRTEGLPVVRDVEALNGGQRAVWLFDSALAEALERGGPVKPWDSVVRDAEDTLHVARPPRQSVLRGVATAAREALQGRPEITEVALSLTLQALRGSSAEDLDPLLTSAPRFVARDKRSMEAAGAFARRFGTVVVMLDEITGEEGSPSSICTMQRWLRSRLVQPFEGREGPRVVLLLADASLATPEAMRQFLSAPEAPARIMTATVAGGPSPVESVPISLALGDHATDGVEGVLVRGDAYPASRLSVGYRVVLTEAERGHNPSQGIVEASRSTRAATEVVAFETLRQELARTTGQVLCFVQNRSLLEVLHARLVKSGTLAEGDAFVLTSETSPRERDELRERRDELRLILMTSSGTRGIDFPMADRLVALLLPTAPEHDLMELVQFAWRGRGGGQDERERHLEVVLIDAAELGVGEAALLRVRRRHADLVAFVLTVRAALHTRIYGSVRRPDGERVAVIPVGRTGTERRAWHLQRMVADLHGACVQYGGQPVVTRLREAADALVDHVTYTTERALTPPVFDGESAWVDAVNGLDVAQGISACGPLLIAELEVLDRAVFSSREVEQLADALKDFLGVARGGEFSDGAVNAALHLDVLCARARSGKGLQELVGRPARARVVVPIHATMVGDDLRATPTGSAAEEAHGAWRDALHAWLALTSGARTPDVGARSTLYRRWPFAVFYDDLDPTGLDDLGSRGVARAGRLANALAAIVMAGHREGGAGTS